VPNITIGPLVVDALRPVTDKVLDCHLVSRRMQKGCGSSVAGAGGGGNAVAATQTGGRGGPRSGGSNQGKEGG
jgi:hypothetical protein